MANKGNGITFVPKMLTVQRLCLYLLSLALISVLACKKEEPTLFKYDCPEHVASVDSLLIDTSLHGYFSFGKGSYWAYAKDGSNELDTLRLTDLDSMRLFLAHNSCGEVQTVQEKRSHTQFSSRLNAPFIVTIAGDRKGVSYIEADSQGVSTNAIQVPVPPSQFVPSLSWDSFQFRQVLIVEVRDPVHQMQREKSAWKYYFARGVGLIQRENEKGERWRLKSYQVFP